MLSIYEKARLFMRETGNPCQWKMYPEEEILKEDVEDGTSFVITDGRSVVGTFAFIVGEDDTYLKIEEGKWLNDSPYGTIHRIASDGTAKGIVEAAVNFALQVTGNVRIDTHRNNKVMQHVLTRLGFSYCGIIYIPDEFSDHSERLAYQRAADPERNKKLELYLNQKKLLDTFLEKRAISQAQYNKSFGDLTEKMDMAEAFRASRKR